MRAVWHRGLAEERDELGGEGLMEFIRRHKGCLAFMLVAALLLVHVAGISLSDRRREVMAAPDEPVVEAIPTSGPALTLDETMAVENFTMSAHTVDSITLSWEYQGTIEAAFYLFEYSEETHTYRPFVSTAAQSYTITGLTEIRQRYFIVCPYSFVFGVQGQYSKFIEAYVKPKKVQGLTLSENTSTSITLGWQAMEGVTGYEIYRARGSGSFESVACVMQEEAHDGVVNYTDQELETARGYRYKVRAYAFAKNNYGTFTAVSKTCTLPSLPVSAIKGGDKKIRISWKAVTRAEGYRLYQYQGDSYQLLETLEGKSNKVYLHQNLHNGEEYSYVVEAYRQYNGEEFSSGYSKELQASAEKPAATSTKAKLYQSKKKFKASDAFQECATMKKLVYDKSFNLPGLVNTNVDGFNSTSMCPQGITFAGSYILLTAYDLASEENSVIYVIKKSNRKLMTTIVLPGKTHAGGITYDGVNVWVSQSNTVHAFPFTEVKKAAAAKQGYYVLPAYRTTVELSRNAGSLCYYKNKLWIAEYNELKQGSMGAYTIEGKKKKPDLTEIASVSIPTKVQGITFASGGRLIFSRSCQTDPTMRGYSHMLDTYKPDLSGLAKGKVALGKCQKSVDMPSMNEEVAVNGNFVYITFESGAFAKAIKRMDRVCAFKITNIVK